MDHSTAFHDYEHSALSAIAGAKDAAALDEHQFEESLEGRPLLQPEEFHDVFRPVGVHPLLKVLLRKGRSEEEGRKPAPQHSMIKIRTAEGGQILEDHGRKKHVGFPTGQGVFEACGCAQGG